MRYTSWLLCWLTLQRTCVWDLAHANPSMQAPVCSLPERHLGYLNILGPGMTGLVLLPQAGAVLRSKSLKKTISINTPHASRSRDSYRLSRSHGHKHNKRKHHSRSPRRESQETLLPFGSGSTGSARQISFCGFTAGLCSAVPASLSTATRAS